MAAESVPLQGRGTPMWVMPQGPINGCPSGLENLLQTDTLLVNQVVELFEVFTGWETANKYGLFNTNGQQVYYAFEKSDTCMRLLCGASRSFTISIVDGHNEECMQIVRQWKCACCWCAGCCDSCAHELKIVSKSGQVLGYVKQAGYCLKLTLNVLDSERNVILRIETPCCCTDGCRCMPEFWIKDLEGNTVGKIFKKWSGLARELWTNADCFGIEFPPGLPVQTKATLLGALFLIDFMIFENKNNK